MERWQCGKCGTPYSEQEVEEWYYLGGCPKCGDNGSWERQDEPDNEWPDMPYESWALRPDGTPR